MFIYEKDRTEANSQFVSFSEKNLSYPMHFHSEFELNYVIDGEIEITVDNTLYNLHKGEAVIIFPKQLHCYSSPKPSNLRIVIFTPNHIGAFANQYKNMIPINNKLDGLDIYEKDFSSSNFFKQKGLLYYIVGILAETTTFITADSIDDFKVMHKILTFIENNFRDECSLKTAAKTLGYAYAYLSRLFIKNMNMSYTEYLNRHRINHALYLLNNGGAVSISEIASQCGFESQCSFNRNFKLYTGTTPCKILKQK